MGVGPDKVKGEGGEIWSGKYEKKNTRETINLLVF